MILGIIPARYGSTRFPGKPLADIGGKTMIRRVYEQAAQADSLSGLVVATDDPRILEEVVSFGGQAVLTAAGHPSGTDRCLEALQLQTGAYAHVINIQGDEPFIDPAQIDLVASVLQQPGTEIATLILPVTTEEDLSDPNKVKVVLSTAQEALYFSRSSIPFLRGIPEGKQHLHHTFYRHIGIYGYRTDILGTITGLPPSALEQAESLEQLRWLEHGFRIRCAVTTHAGMGIDHPGDIEKALAYLAK